jgi:hypothetical protein
LAKAGFELFPLLLLSEGLAYANTDETVELKEIRGELVYRGEIFARVAMISLYS